MSPTQEVSFPVQDHIENNREQGGSEEVFAVLRSMVGDPEDFKEVTDEDPFEQRIKSLPRDLQRAINDNLEFDKKEGIAISPERKQRYLDQAEKIYKESRFGREFLSRMGINKKLQDHLHDALSKESVEGVEELSRVARVSIDINGLKAMNDLMSHETGNEFLKRMATRIAELQTQLKMNPDIEGVDVAFEGGDEFGLVVTWKEGVTQDSEIRAEELQSFFNEGLRIKCDDLLSKEMIEQERIFVPEDYPGFYSSAGVGVSTLDTLLEDESMERITRELNERQRVTGDVSPETKRRDTYFAAMGVVLDKADHDMQHNKKVTKEGLDRTTQEVLARNEEVREARREIQTLKERMAGLEAQHNECVESLKSIRTA